MNESIKRLMSIIDTCDDLRTKRLLRVWAKEALQISVVKSVVSYELLEDTENDREYIIDIKKRNFLKTLDMLFNEMQWEEYDAPYGREYITKFASVKNNYSI